MLPFLGLAVVLSGARLVLTFVDLGSATGGTPATQTVVFAVLWIAGYFAEAVAGYLLWHHRGRHRYGRGALVLFWIQIGLQIVRLLTLVAVRVVPGGLPWAAFGTAALLSVAIAVTMVAAWTIVKPAAVLLGAVLVWLLAITAITGADAILRYGPPLS